MSDLGIINDGLYIEYHSNENVKLHGLYSNNKKTGNWIGYYENSTKKSEITYENGNKYTLYFCSNIFVIFKIIVLTLFNNIFSG